MFASRQVEEAHLAWQAHSLSPTSILRAPRYAKSAAALPVDHMHAPHVDFTQYGLVHIKKVISLLRSTRNTPSPPFIYTTTPCNMSATNVVKQNSSELSARSDIYSHTAKVPGLIFCSGQVPMDGQGKIVPGDVKEHCAQCIGNLEKALKNAGSGLDQLVKVNVRRCVRHWTTRWPTLC